LSHRLPDLEGVWCSTDSFVAFLGTIAAQDEPSTPKPCSWAEALDPVLLSEAATAAEAATPNRRRRVNRVALAMEASSLREYLRLLLKMGAVDQSRFGSVPAPSVVSAS
jgi:hypothetical protein